ncbi:MAG: hypothetical protein GY711_03455 [bacterium]|nr:hypothetical protein [bacterium]
MNSIKGPAPELARGLRFSPWAVFDDDGDDILVVNAYDNRRSMRLFRKRDEVRRLLNNERGAVSDIDRAVLGDLMGMGAVVPEDDPPLPEPRGPEKRRAAPVLRRVVLELDVNKDWERSVESVRAFCADYGRVNPAWRIDLCIAGSDVIEDVDLLTSKLLRAFALDELAPERFTWQLRLPRIPDGEALPQLLDNWTDLQLVIEDRSELSDAIEREDELVRAEALAKQGFLLRPAILTRCGEDLVDAVKSWQGATDRAGVLVEPLLTDTYGEYGARPLESASDFEAAADVVADVARTLGASILSSEPWASMLVYTTVPGVQRHAWSRRLTGGFIDAEGRWARSRRHAESFLHAPAEELFPYVYPTSPAGVVESSDPWPDCVACAFAPLCDGYWSPEMDVLARTGDPERAAHVAALACALRKDALAALLDEVRQDFHKLHQEPGRTHATYADGVLSLQRNPR